MSELKEKATKGMFWSAAEQLSVQGLQFVFGLVIARMVSPAEYGLIAMLTIFIAVAQVFVDSGFSSALIQKADRTIKDFSTVFYFNIVISISAYLVLFVSAPYIAEFYRQPELTMVLRIVSLSIVINSLGAIQRTKYTIDLNFKTPAIISLAAALISGIIGVVMAFMGYGVWSLVAVTLAGNIVVNGSYWMFSRWHPSLIYSWTSFRTLFSFGSKMLVSGLIRAIYTNLYSLIIGRKYNAADIGYFNRANSLAVIFTDYFVMILERVSYPVLCSIQNDNERLSTIFNKLISLAVFIIFPIVTTLMVLAYPLIEIVLTAKWLSAAPLLQIICVAYAMSPLICINSNILKARGRSDYFLHSEIIKKSIGVITLFATISFGLTWLCIGLIISNVISTFISIYYAKRVVKTGLWMQLRSIAKIVIASVVMGGVMWGVTEILDSVWLKVLIGGTVGFVSYFIAIKVLKIQEYDAVIDMVKGLKSK